MKEYLDELIGEYESNIKNVDEGASESPNHMIANPPFFIRFVEGDGGDIYTKKFLGDYREAARMIRKHLLQPE